MNSIILSPVGTSIFTKRDYPPEISIYSNYRTLSDIPSDRRGIIKAYIAETKNKLMQMSISEAKIRSAELNGIIQFYQNDLANAPDDTHYLLPSDTYIGSQACSIVQDYLLRYFSDVRILKISDLQTSDCDSFQYALSDLVSRVMLLKMSLRPDQRLIFNLTGGFKAILGFLQSLGMFYADETIYVFEFSNSLMRIPALPVKLEPYEYLLDHVAVFRRLDNNLPITELSYAKIPLILVLTLFGEPTLSAYGKIVWDSFRKRIYSAKLLDSISSKVVFSATFINSSLQLETDRYYPLNCKIDLLSKFTELKEKPNPASLDFKKLKTKHKISTHEFDAWADKDAKRVFCHYEGEKLILDCLDSGLH